MISKIINLLLVYLLSFLNFGVLLLPYLVLFHPILRLTNFYGNGFALSILFALFVVSSIMLVYIAFDFIFGFTMRSMMAGTLSPKKYPNYLESITIGKKMIQERFGMKNIKIVIKNDTTVNAYALGSFGGNAIILTTGLLNKLFAASQNKEEFNVVLCGVLAHEASHIINKDFLPGTLLNINKKATHRVSQVTSVLYTCVLILLSRIPVFGKIFANLSKVAFNLVYKTSVFFMEKIILQIYTVVAKILTRSIEYRSDMDSAKAIGYEGISSALCMITSGYTSIFSNHPSTSDRLKNVKDVTQIRGIVDESLITFLLNFLAVLMMVAIPCYLGFAIKIWNVYDIISGIIAQFHQIVDHFSGIVRSGFGTLDRYVK